MVDGVGRGTGRPTSSARANFFRNPDRDARTARSFRKNPPLNPNTSGLDHNSAYVETFCLFVDNRVTDPVTSDFTHNYHPRLPKRIRYVMILVTRGPRGKGDGDAQEQAQEMTLKILTDSGEKKLGFDVFQGDKPLAIHISDGTLTFDVIEGSGKDERTWRITLASFDAPQASASRNLLHHLKTACQNVPRDKLSYVNVALPPKPPNHDEGSKSDKEAFTISVGDQEWSFTGFFLRNRDEIEAMRVKDAAPKKEPKWMTKKKQKRQVKRERRLARKAEKALADNPEMSDQEPDPTASDEGREDHNGQDERATTPTIPEISSETDARVERTASKRSHHRKASSVSSKRRGVGGDPASSRVSLSDADAGGEVSDGDDDEGNFEEMVT